MNHPHERGSGILETEWHGDIAEAPEWSDESCFDLVGVHTDGSDGTWNRPLKKTISRIPQLSRQFGRREGEENDLSGRPD